MTSIMQTRRERLPAPGWVLRADMLPVVILIGLTLVLRLTNLNYNTMFVDEAFTASVGREALAGVNLSHPEDWMFGASFTYPPVAALAYQVGGLTGMRVLSALMLSAATLVVFGTTKTLFKREAALWAAFVFGLSGGSISIGQFATYDAPGIFFLAISVYALVISAYTAGWRSQRYVIISGAAFALSFLSKYIALAYLPTLGFLAVGLYLWKRKSPFALIGFLLPVFLMIGSYGVAYWPHLKQAFQTQVNQFPLTRGYVLQIIIAQIGLPMILSVFALVPAAQQVIAERKIMGTKMRWLVYVAIGAALLSTLALPVYHWVSLASSNSRAVEKHCIYALVLLAPFAGLALERIAAWLQMLRVSIARHIRLPTAAFLVIGIVLMGNTALDVNWLFQTSWPNVNQVVNYLHSRRIDEDTRILATAAPIYENIFALPLEAGKKVWMSTWSFQYAGLSDMSAMKKGIQDHYFDYVILDDYYNPPELSQTLLPFLKAAGYVVAFEDTQQLQNWDTRRIQVFTTPVKPA